MSSPSENHMLQSISTHTLNHIWRPSIGRSQFNPRRQIRQGIPLRAILIEHDEPGDEIARLGDLNVDTAADSPGGEGVLHLPDSNDARV